MIHDFYSFTASPDHRRFEFISIGQRGKFLKRVDLIPTESPFIYNLGLGDVDERGNIYEWKITNNGDTAKVLNTVNRIVLEFIKLHPLYEVILKGSNPARNRLFKMHISANIDSLSKQLSIFGYSKGNWEKFEKSHNYSIFLIRRKR